MREVVFVDGMRTPFGKQGGTLYLRIYCGLHRVGHDCSDLAAAATAVDSGGAGSR